MTKYQKCQNEITKEELGAVSSATLERLQGFYDVSPTDLTGKSFKLARAGGPTSKLWTVVGTKVIEGDELVMITDSLSHIEFLSPKRVRQIA